MYSRSPMMRLYGRKKRVRKESPQAKDRSICAISPSTAFSPDVVPVYYFQYGCAYFGHGLEVYLILVESSCLIRSTSTRQQTAKVVFANRCHLLLRQARAATPHSAIQDRLAQQTQAAYCCR